MRPVATIKHNDPSRLDRVTLGVVDGNQYIYAAATDEQPYETDVPVGDILAAWGAHTWDLEWMPGGEEAIETHSRR